MVESLTFSLRFLNPTMYQELLEKLKKKKEKSLKNQSQAIFFSILV